MTSHSPISPALQTSPDLDLAQEVLQLPELHLQHDIAMASNVQLMRLDEINEGRPQAYRKALASVYATLNTEKPTRLIYLLEGDRGKVALYMGAAVAQQEGDAHEAIKELLSAL